MEQQKSKRGPNKVSRGMVWKVMNRFAVEHGIWVCFTKRHVSEIVAGDLGVPVEEIEKSIHFHMLRIEKLGGLVKVGSVEPRGRGRPRTLYMQPVYVKATN